MSDEDKLLRMLAGLACNGATVTMSQSEFGTGIGVTINGTNSETLDFFIKREYLKEGLDD